MIERFTRLFEFKNGSKVSKKAVDEFIHTIYKNLDCLKGIEMITLTEGKTAEKKVVGFELIFRFLWRDKQKCDKK